MANTFVYSKAVLLVDDQPEFLAFARQLLHGQAGIRVVGEVTDGTAALRLLPSVQPDAVIVDIIMPNMGGFETARRLLEADPNLCIILVSANEEPQYEALARQVGAAGFISKKRFDTGTVRKLLRRSQPADR